jgi:CHASE2 domain
MMFPVSALRLTVVRVDQSCWFELAWGQAQTLKAQVHYPESLLSVYQAWQRVYLSFYQSNLLGKAEFSGTLELPESDWHGLLVKAEAALLNAFNQWLRQSELYEIRSAMIQATKSLGSMVGTVQNAHPVDIFLTCTPMELARLPWEAWELWATAGNRIRVFRTPLNIHHDASIHKQSRSPRLLVIIGSDDKNHFTDDLQTVKNQFRHIAQVEAMGWQLTAQDIPELKRQIRDAITSPIGWDALLFFGHSNESALTGGELAIAPNTWISIQELTPQLLKAKAQGLQFALFNSCSGLNIAESLISLGLGQVAIMREPIHNTVAQYFLVQFLQQLARQENVHQALISTCQTLAIDHQLTYPSASLIPSLFRYPNAPLFQLKYKGWRQWVKNSMPTRWEAILTGVLALLSTLWPIQDGLLDVRMLAQAVYRDIDHEVVAAIGSTKSSKQATPPILLIQIDDESLRRDHVTQRRPLDRDYLAKVADQVAMLNPSVIGIDYVLDEPQPKTDSALARSMQNAARHGIRFVLATVPEALNTSAANSHNRFLDARWSFPGSIEGSHRFMPRVSASMNCAIECHFAQMLAIASQHSFPSATTLSWLTPINDLSLSPNEVFQVMSASQVLTNTTEQWSQLKRSQSPIILIAPGGYTEAGIRNAGEDNLPMPWATSYWRSRLDHPKNASDVFTGGEAHAYRVYQLLTQKWVMPLPDIFLIGFAALLGKQMQLQLQKRALKKRRWKGSLFLLTGGYGIAGLQLYVAAGILCPWLFPSIIFWCYVYPVLEKKADE